MSEAVKVEEPVVAAPVATEPVVDAPAAVEATPEAATEEPAAAAAAVETTEAAPAAAVEEVKPVEEGVLGYKGPGLLKYVHHLFARSCASSGICQAYQRRYPPDHNR